MPNIILVTGASTGIGAATAIALAQPDAQVIIHYHAAQKEAEQTADRVSTKGALPHLIQANLATDAGCKKVTDFLEKQFGSLTTLVNNAGGLVQRHRVEDISWDLLERIFALNAFSTMRLTNMCLPFLKKSNDASITNITSVAIRTGAPMAPIYGAAKGAIDVFTRGLAKALAPNIRVNAIAPGFIDTPFHKHASPELMQSAITNTPLKKVGQPEDIADVICMLVRNNFCTGETIDINGGMFMR